MAKGIYVLGFVLCILIGSKGLAQPVITNGGFENWQNLGTITEEPADWNSFKSASGGISGMAAQQIRRSPVIRAGSTGNYSAVIWSRSIMGIVANGVVTTGQVNMGSATVMDSNYNVTRTALPDFSEALTADVDSLVFWVKFVPANAGGTDSARANAIIHDNYNYRDPSTSDVNGPAHVVAKAELNFPKTNGWARKSIAFNYSGPASVPAFILITFTTNKNAGSGSGGDSLYIDDVEYKNTSWGIHETVHGKGISVYTDHTAERLVISLNFEQTLRTEISVYNIAGQKIMNSERAISSSKEFMDMSGLGNGLYLLDITRADGNRFTQKFIVY
jgi:hypothetical protein